ncbi:hypothetical protein D9613_002127 [Agrocybe pediades]|uniref:UBC core domain-containing protein n=1 Tax=Agrocybe pediades TaxID=84607 RepID=A0A8H4R4S8_9AGAR|nr:hypothetical protein D9613_002127 [Agrocybe pediades]
MGLALSTDMTTTQSIAEPERYGVVSRSWHDVEDHPPIEAESDPLMRPLKYGEVGVAWVSHGGEREILPASDLRLVDRVLRPSDYCKKSFDDARAGVVASVKVKAKVAHAISGAPVEGWFTVEDFRERADADVGDYVIYDDWLGQVFDEAIVQVSSGDHLVRLPELGSRLVVGVAGYGILPTDPFSGISFRNAGKEVVIAIKHNTYAITWLALNQMLDQSIAEKKMRPQRFWSGEDMGKLTLFRPHFEQEIQYGDRLHLKDVSKVPTTEHGRPDDPTGVVHVQTVMVTQTATELEVLWQDGSRETVRSVDVVPYFNTDEYDCWPGDHVLWKSEQGSRPAVVQSVNAIERTSLVLLPDTGVIELASLLELDTVGNVEHETDLSPEAFGVQRGDIVFINAPSSSRSTQAPRMPRIGELEPWVHEPPFHGGQPANWRKEMLDIGSAIAAKRNAEPYTERAVQLPAKGSGELTWIGEVYGLNLDGTVEVRHADDTSGRYTLDQLTLLYDGIEQLEAAGWDDGNGSHAGDEQDEWDMDMGDDYIEHSGEHGAAWNSPSLHVTDIRNHQTDDDNQTDSMDVDDEVRSLSSEHMSVEGIQDTASHSATNTHTETAVRTPHDLEKPLDLSTPSQDQTSEEESDRFQILPSAPPDHAFFSSAHAQPSKSFLGRLGKEYRILRNSLPDSILVRAYEDRTDLLRSLIIGPENTPYQDAPFVIDWMLDSNFPNSPPIAHFLSWTNGNGREYSPQTNLASKSEPI